MDPDAAKKYLVRGLLLAVLLFAVFLRLWSLDFGLELPYLAHTDEPRLYNSALRIIHSGDPNPHDFYKPTLTIYLDAAVMLLGFGVGKLWGVYESVTDLQPINSLTWSVGLVGSPEMLILGRAASAMFGVLTVGLVYLITRELTRRTWLPLVTAAMLAVSGLHIRLSHYMTVDVIATFFAVASVGASTIALRRMDRRFLWVAALCGGLAVSSKYNYVVLAVPVGLACLLYSSSWMIRMKHLFLCGALFCLAFAFTSPYVFLDYSHAGRNIAYEIKHYAGGHLGMAGNSLRWYLALLWSINPFYLILGVPGLFLVFARGRREAWPMAVFVLVNFALIAKQAVHFDRNVLPVMALLIVVSGVAIEAFLDIIPAKLRYWRVGLSDAKLSPVIAGAILIPLLPSLLALPGFLQPPSPSGKALAQEWFDHVLGTEAGQRYLHKGGEDSLMTVAEAYTSYLDPQACEVEYLPTVTSFEGGLPEVRDKGYDMAVLGSGMFARFYQNADSFDREVRTYDEFFDQVPDVMAFRSEPNPLEFIHGGSDVYVFLLSERARRFGAEASPDPSE